MNQVYGNKPKIANFGNVENYGELPEPYIIRVVRAIRLAACRHLGYLLHISGIEVRSFRKQIRATDLFV